jgi:hypothetical protein
MPTEDDLRVAFRDMERFTPDAADVLRAVYERPQRPARSRYGPPRLPRRPALRASLAVGAAGALAAVAVIAAVAHGHTPSTRATITAPALRARLLAAIDTASGDILYMQGGPAPGGGTWLSPAYPQPGQKVHFRILGLGSGGQVFKDGEYSFTMPAETGPPSRYLADLDQGGLHLSGTDLVVNHFRHVWSVWHGRFILGFPLDAAGIRAEIASGQFTVVGQTELHGQQAIELQINVPPSNEAPPHTTASRLWVNATTYLPMQQYVRMSNGEQSVQEYTFLPPTPENLAKLRPVIPAGYKHINGNSGNRSGRPPKTVHQ